VADAHRLVRVRGARSDLVDRAWLAELSEVDLNGDNLPDYIAHQVSVDGQGDLTSHCGNYGECEMGVLVSCAASRLAEVVPVSYFTSLASSDEGERAWAGLTWRGVAEERRIAGSQMKEAERIDRGQPLGETVIWRMDGGRYRRDREGAAGLSDRCAELRRAERWAQAHAICARALGASAGRPELEGAVHYELGRVAEGLGRPQAAAEHYRRSLEARPGNAIVEGRLEALR
jgi:hypothetical protein